MQFALWVYPWDLIDEGVETVVDRCVELGVDELNLATSYHSVQPFLPHNPERKTLFARASAYFQPDEEEYGDLSPVPNEKMGDADWLSTIERVVADTELSLNSWTVGCHDSRLGMDNPELTLTSPFGDSLAFGLCPSQPAVQEYLRGLVSDLSSRRQFDRIELETFDYFHGTGFGWHHDKYHVELGDLTEFLLGLCFCDACTDRARDAGIDVDAARDRSRERIEEGIDGRTDVNARAWIERQPELSEYVDHRRQTLAGLYSDLRDAVGGDADLGRYTGFLNVEDAWMHGADLSALSDHLDYHTVIAYEGSREAVLRRVDSARRLSDDTPVHAGILPGHPAIDERATVTDVVDGLAAANVDRVSVYNYGLLPERNLNWTADAVATHR
jgi:hypothetical protein